MNAAATRRPVAESNVPSGLATSAGGSPAGLRELFGNSDFVRLWLATGIQLTVNSALQFVLLIRVVELSGSSLAAVALVIVLAAPPVVFGLATGVLLDRLDKRRVLLVTVIIRSGLTAVLLIADNVSVGAIFAVAFLTATAGQFALPAGASSLPAFVKRSQLLAANSAFQFTATSTQLIGLVVLSPIMLKALGFDASYILSAALLLATAPLLAKLPPLPPHPREQNGDAGTVNGGWGQVRSAIGMGLADVHEAALRVWRDRLTAVALIQLITGVMLLFMFAVLVPRFVQDVLGRHPEDAVFVFWPTGVGALAVLIGLPWLARHFRVAVLASVGLAVNHAGGRRLRRARPGAWFVVRRPAAWPHPARRALPRLLLRDGQRARADVAARAHPARDARTAVLGPADDGQRRLDGCAGDRRRGERRCGNSRGAVPARRGRVRDHAALALVGPPGPVGRGLGPARRLSLGCLATVPPPSRHRPLGAQARDGQCMATAWLGGLR